VKPRDSTPFLAFAGKNIVLSSTSHVRVFDSMRKIDGGDRYVKWFIKNNSTRRAMAFHFQTGWGAAKDVFVGPSLLRVE